MELVYLSNLGVNIQVGKVEPVSGRMSSVDKWIYVTRGLVVNEECRRLQLDLMARSGYLKQLNWIRLKEGKRERGSKSLRTFCSTDMMTFCKIMS